MGAIICSWSLWRRTYRPDFSGQGQASARQGGIRAGQTIAVAGQRTNFNHYTLDGVENTDPNFNTFVVLPSIDALQEFKVQTGVYPAEFGREATQINVLTKSGTNQYHGTLFEFFRNDKLDATGYAFSALRPSKDPFKWNQYGFTLGGPVRMPKVFNGKDKLFFMANYESYRKRGNTTALYSLASAAIQSGDFSAIANRIYDPTTHVLGADGKTITATPFPGNIIPQSRISLDFETISGVLPHSHAAGLREQFRRSAGTSGEPRPVHPADGLCGVVASRLGQDGTVGAMRMRRVRG